MEHKETKNLRKGLIMKKGILYLVLVIGLSGCNIHMQGHDFVTTGKTIKYLSSSSVSQAGLRESFRNCLQDALDPMNRGSRCN